MPSSPASRTAVQATVVLAVAGGVFAASLVSGNTPRARAAALTPYQSCTPLLAHYRAELVRTATAWGFGNGFRRGPGIWAEDTARAAAPSAAGTTTLTSGAVGSGPTGTNVQEAGVDEPDSVKLAGGVLYVANGDKVHLIRAGAEPALLSSVKTGNGYGVELLVAGERLLVLTPGWKQAERSPVDGGRGADLSIYRPGQETTTLSLYDVSAPASPRLLEDYTIEARYVSARLSDGRVRLVTMATPQLDGGVYPTDRTGEDQALARNRELASRIEIDAILPHFTRRNARGGVLSSGRAVQCTDVARATGARGASTLVVTTLRPARGLAPTDTTGVTTDGDLIYATADRLFVATSRWGTVQPAADPRADVIATNTGVSTELHAFATGDRDSTSYVGSGSVPGYLYGRWALSFHEGHLRVAATDQPPWGGDREEQSSSSVFVLAERDGQLARVGRVGGLGKGEQIQAVRYFGDIATVVTFRRTDPLYVVDLSDPTAPKVRGELKIPGFSTYLHPVGDGLVVGLGHDADTDGRVTGMQLSLFDLTDLDAPKQIHRLPLGSGYSEALHESRAFSYDPVHRIAMLPYMGWDGRSGSTSALGVEVTPENKLREAGRLALGSGSWARRVLYDGDRAYAVTERAVVAADLAMHKLGQVNLPVPR